MIRTTQLTETSNRCLFCDRPFRGRPPTRPFARFCSEDHLRAHHLASGKSVTDFLNRPTVLPYLLKCMMCSRTTDVLKPFMLTAQAAELATLRGFRPCQECGGFRYLELDDSGGSTHSQKDLAGLAELWIVA